MTDHVTDTDAELDALRTQLTGAEALAVQMREELRRAERVVEAADRWERSDYEECDAASDALEAAVRAYRAGEVEARAARAPRPPEELVGALQDRIHPTSGRLLAAKPIATTRRKAGDSPCPTHGMDEEDTTPPSPETVEAYRSDHLVAPGEAARLYAVECEQLGYQHARAALLNRYAAVWAEMNRRGA